MFNYIIIHYLFIEQLPPVGATGEVIVVEKYIDSFLPILTTTVLCAINYLCTL